MKSLELSGEPYVRGKAHGLQFRPQIREVVAKDRMATERVIQERTGIALPDEHWLSLVRRYLVHVEEYAPDLVEEVRGIADGADLPFEQLFAFNAFLDFCDLSSRPLAPKLLFGCTTFAAANIATQDGRAYLGQNYDWRTIYRPAATLLQYHRSDGPSALLFTFAGLLGCAGMNSAGLGIVINKLTPSDSRPGVTYPFILRKALEQTNIPDAIGAIVGAHRASGIFYLIADNSGEIIGVETTATDYDILYAMEDYLGHANHYVHPRLLPYDAPNRWLKADTYVRWSRINKLLQRRCGQIGLDDLQAFTRDHVGYICHHPEPGCSELDSEGTNAGLIMDLKSLKLWLALGNPCENEYVEYGFPQQCI